MTIESIPAGTKSMSFYLTLTGSFTGQDRFSILTRTDQTSTVETEYDAPNTCSLLCIDLSGGINSVQFKCSSKKSSCSVDQIEFH